MGLSLQFNRLMDWLRSINLFPPTLFRIACIGISLFFLGFFPAIAAERPSPVEIYEAHRKEKDWSVKDLDYVSPENQNHFTDFSERWALDRSGMTFISGESELPMRFIKGNCEFQLTDEKEIVLPVDELDYIPREPQVRDVPNQPKTKKNNKQVYRANGKCTLRKGLQIFNRTTAEISRSKDKADLYISGIQSSAFYADGTYEIRPGLFAKGFNFRFFEDGQVSRVDTVVGVTHHLGCGLWIAGNDHGAYSLNTEFMAEHRNHPLSLMLTAPLVINGKIIAQRRQEVGFVKSSKNSSSYSVVLLNEKKPVRVLAEDWKCPELGIGTGSAESPAPIKKCFETDEYKTEAGRQCITVAGVIFQRYRNPRTGDLGWYDRGPEGKIWYDKDDPGFPDLPFQKRGLNLHAAQKFCGGNGWTLPSQRVFAIAEQHGLTEILASMRQSIYSVHNEFWVSPTQSREDRNSMVIYSGLDGKFESAYASVEKHIRCVNRR